VTPTVALAGNPNVGKTSLFNELTGAQQHVGNWPGKTVERVAGVLEVDEAFFEIVDLPGTYGLLPVSMEEEISSIYLFEERPEVVVTVVDATNLERSLHLAVQIAELGLRQVVALNMSDVAERRGREVDRDRLVEALGVEAIRTVGRRGEGVPDLRRALVAAVDHGLPQPLVVDYGPILERQVGGIVAEIAATPEVASLAPPRWTALQLIAGDETLAARLGGVAGGDAVVEAAREAHREVSADAGVDAGLLVAERRFEWIQRLVARSGGPDDQPDRPTASERVDGILTHRFLGLPVFLVVMWIVLRITADVTAPYVGWVGGVVAGPVSRWAVSGLGAVGLDGGWVEGLVVDGILTGVGGVLIFVPLLFGLYLTLAVLEDTGYMARAAIVMERAMRAIGLPGKAFLPMMVGFGCTVPAIYATRTLDTQRDRLLTGLLTPFMSCGARLPVYVLLASVFFVGGRSTVVFAMYLTGIAMAVAIGAVLSRTVFREAEPVPFVMVVPEFRLPHARTVWSLVKRRTWAFVRGAGTLILGASIAVWLLLAIPIGGGSFADTDIVDSAFGGASRLVSPVMSPLGLGEWEQSGALLSGFVAKEVVVSTMAQLYTGTDPEPAEGESGGFVADLGSIGTDFLEASLDTLRAIPGVVGLDVVDLSAEHPTGLQQAMRSSFEASSGGRGDLAALAFMVFVLLYTPCVAAVSAFRHEFGVRWMWVSVLGQFVVAWLAALLVFQGGRMLGLG